jgi:hypothetical protein
MTGLLLKFSPYIAAVIVVFGGGWYVGGLAPKAALQRLQAADWQAKAQGEAVALKAVQAQLAHAQTIAANNAQTVEKLSVENNQIAADRSATLDRVRRLEQLLVVASHPAVPGHHMPEAGRGQGTPSASDTTGITSIEGLLVAAASECEQTANQLNALIAEIEPQL